MSGEQKKFRVSKELQAESLQKAYSYFKDEVCTRIADLTTLSKLFAADLFCHKNYVNYIWKWHRANLIRQREQNPKQKETYSRTISFPELDN